MLGQESEQVSALEEIVTRNREQTISEIDTFTERRYEQFVRHLPRNVSNVLDVGCNTGRGGAVMKRSRPSLRITGLDCVPERVAALDRTIYLDTICSFTNDIQCASETFDAVVAGEFIEHLPPDQVYPTLCEFFRILNLRGVVLLTTPNPNYVKNTVRRRTVLGHAHLSQHYIDSLRRRLRDVGFSHVKARGSGRVSTVLGERFPLRSVYGSYLIKAMKW